LFFVFLNPHDKVILDPKPHYSPFNISNFKWTQLKENPPNFKYGVKVCNVFRLKLDYNPQLHSLTKPCPTSTPLSIHSSSDWPHWTGQGRGLRQGWRNGRKERSVTIRTDAYTAQTKAPETVLGRISCGAKQSVHGGPQSVITQVYRSQTFAHSTVVQQINNPRVQEGGKIHNTKINCFNIHSESMSDTIEFTRVQHILV